MDLSKLSLEEKETRILQIHEQLFIFLERERSFMPGLRYTLRKRNNKERLEKGYWFLGNENWVGFSFWAGFDWKHRTPIIHLGISLEGKLNLQLVAKDSEQNQRMFKELAADLGNMEESVEGMVWQKSYGSPWPEKLSVFFQEDYSTIESYILEFTLKPDVKYGRTTPDLIDADEFEKSLEKVNKYRKAKLESKDPGLPFSLQSVRIKDFKGIKETEVEGLPADANWIFVTGENGFGKTTILQALAVGLYGNEDEDFIPVKRFGQIEIAYHHFNESKRIIRTGENGKPPPFTQLTAYGPYRVLPRHFDLKGDSLPVIRNLFSEDAYLLNLENQLALWYSNRDIKKFEYRYNQVKEVLLELMGDAILDLEVDREKQRILYTEQDQSGKVFPAVTGDMLASGYQSIVGMVGDMILRLFQHQPEVSHPSELTGIVIIDELDVHFHPRLQHELPTKLTEAFPEIQFIASTHSPIPILGSPEGSVFLKVERNQESGITLRRIDIDVSNLLPNAILTSDLFGLDGEEIEAKTNKNPEDIILEDDYQEYLRQREVDAELKAFEEGDETFPEHLFKD